MYPGDPVVFSQPCHRAGTYFKRAFVSSELVTQRLVEPRKPRGACSTAIAPLVFVLPGVVQVIFTAVMLSAPSADPAGK